jgi:hypothetical protein
MSKHLQDLGRVLHVPYRLKKPEALRHPQRIALPAMYTVGLVAEVTEYNGVPVRVAMNRKPSVPAISIASRRTFVDDS